MQTVFLDFGSVTRGDIDRTILEQATSPWTYHDNTAQEQVMERIREAEIVVSNKVLLDRAAIFAANRLKLICVAATGYNNVDLAAAAERNIPVCNVRNYATPSVAQHALMFMLNFACRFTEYQQLIKKGGWQTSTYFCPLDFSVMELAGKTLGIIGYGELGKAVARLAEAFGMQLLIAEHKSASAIRPGRTAFNDVIRKADFITLHCPLSEATRDLISEQEFNQIKSSAYLINTARSDLINEHDLLQALYSGQIAGAAIDVLKEEPPVNGSPLLDYPHPNLLVTPHSAWASIESRQRMINLLAANIRNFLHNKPFNQINLSA